MPPKRKAAAISARESPAKPHTRSSGPLIETQVFSEPQARPRRTAATRSNATVSSPAKSRARSSARRSLSLQSLKENKPKEVNDFSGSDAASDSEDELILSSKKTSIRTYGRKRTIANVRLSTPQTATPRMFIEAVEIVTPSKVRTHREHFDSPSPVAARMSKRQTRPEKPIDLLAPLSKRRKLTVDTETEKPQVVSPDSQFSCSSTPTISPLHLPGELPRHLYPCFHAQRHAMLRALRTADVDWSEGDEDGVPPANGIAMQQLGDLLNGTVYRGEGNSCLLLGPRGSGKSTLMRHCLSKLPDRPIVLRLSGWSETNDRLALREIAYQLSQQTGTSFQSHVDPPGSSQGEANEESNPFLDKETATIPFSLPPSSYLTALISMIPTLPRPTIVILDAFDLFALHPRQALLYCLLDTVQSCRAGSGQKAMAVVGLTSRLDTINLLEKRVKSRFSGRTIRTAPPRIMTTWQDIVRRVLLTPFELCGKDQKYVQQWRDVWTTGIEKFLSDDSVTATFNEAFSVSRDIRTLNRMVIHLATQLTPSSPFPLSKHLISGAATQRLRPLYSHLHALPYPSVCLIIASIHSRTAGHDTFTFEMLHEAFQDQVRASTAAPVQVNGGSIGMVRCTREVLMNAFEDLITSRIFVCVTAPSSSIPKEFLKYRCVLDYEAVKVAVQKVGQTNLRNWLNKAR